MTSYRYCHHCALDRLRSASPLWAAVL